MSLDKARRKRQEADMASKGWQFASVPANDPADNVRVWLYSVSPLTGQRYAGQLTTPFYRDMVTGGGLFHQITANTPSTPFALLDQTFERVKKGELQGKRASQSLALVLANFVRTTDTWAGLLPLSEVDGIHLVICDWETDSGSLIIGSMAAYSAKPLSVHELAECMAALLKKQLDISLDNAPKGLR